MKFWWSLCVCVCSLYLCCSPSRLEHTAQRQHRRLRTQRWNKRVIYRSGLPNLWRHYVFITLHHFGIKGLETWLLFDEGSTKGGANKMVKFGLESSEFTCPSINSENISSVNSFSCVYGMQIEIIFTFAFLTNTSIASKSWRNIS